MTEIKELVKILADQPDLYAEQANAMLTHFVNTNGPRRMLETVVQHIAEETQARAQAQASVGGFAVIELSNEAIIARIAGICLFFGVRYGYLAANTQQLENLFEQGGAPDAL